MSQRCYIGTRADMIAPNARQCGDDWFVADNAASEQCRHKPVHMY